MDFYYATVDENGVLCVDRLDEEGGPWTEERLTAIATSYPEMIYFAVETVQ